MAGSAQENSVGTGKFSFVNMWHFGDLISRCLLFVRILYNPSKGLLYSGRRTGVCFYTVSGDARFKRRGPNNKIRRIIFKGPTRNLGQSRPTGDPGLTQ